MQAVAIILTVIALYAAMYSFCKVAAEADEQADRYKRRVLQARTTLPDVWRISARVPAPRFEVVRGR